MQRCPKCGRTYENDTQKFCTHDGGRLGVDETPEASGAPTAYDLNQTVITDPFDPEATVTRLPDLNKTVTSAPTSEIRSNPTGPAVPPTSTAYPQPPSQMARPGSDAPPTVTFTPPPAPPAQQYPPAGAPQMPAPQPAQPQHPQQPPHAQYAGAPQQPQGHYRPSPPAAQQHYEPGPQAQASQTAGGARKSSRMPLVIALVVIVLLGGAAAWYFLIYKKSEAGTNTNSNVANANSNANGAANGNSNAGGNTNTGTTTDTIPPPNSTQFINSSANLDGKLSEKYSDFSFYYPNSWAVDPKSGVAGASNFVRVERSLPPDFTQENFTVSWYDSQGTLEADKGNVFPKLVESLKARLAKGYPEFKVLSESETTVNGIKGYEFRFESVSRGTEKGDITLWGRVVFLPPGKDGETNGVQLLMLTTSLAPELLSADDVGVKGELPVILNSFKLGTSK